jgi:hypothetical protein
MTRLINALYTDPAYEQLRLNFGQLSDDYPVTLLPVRLETRFVNETRIKVVRSPGKRELGVLLNQLYPLHYWVEKLILAIDDLKAAELKKQLQQINTQVGDLQKSLGVIKELRGGDKTVLRQALQEIANDFDQLEQKDKSLKKMLRPIQKQLGSFLSQVDGIDSPKESIYEPGYRYLDTLTKIEKDLDKVFYERGISSSRLDAQIDGLNQKMADLEIQIKNPKFRATEKTISKIKSKVSYLKRRHKKSPITLTAYKKAYSGKRDLNTYNHVLKTRFTTLKQKVDKQHVPFMEISEKLQRYPVQQLQHRVSRAYWYLKAQNEGIKTDYESVMAVKEDLYDHLLGIRNRAHRPLDGTKTEINDLKKEYALLEKQVQIFLKKAAKVNAKDRYKKAALTRLNTHLTEEYLEDLQDLLPGKKSLEEQVFSDYKLRTTSASATASLEELENTTQFLKSTKVGGQKQALQLLTKRLSDAKENLRVSASNTHLLPRAEFLKLQDKLNSLRSQYTNALKNNKVAKSDPARDQGWAIINELAKEVENQQVDVFDQKDRFYDEYRKRITFVTHSETIKELWVRIFPDDIAINNHDERLTKGETEIAKDYYYEVYSKLEADRPAAQLGAWRAAAASMGVRRAAFALRHMRPQDLDFGPIPERVDDLRAYWISLSKKLPAQDSLRGVFNSVTPEKTTQALTKLPAELQLLLTHQNFTPCAEHFDTFNRVVKGLKSTIVHCQKELQGTKKVSEQSIYRTWLNALENGLVLINQYYSTTKHLFAQPYRVALSFPTREQKESSWAKAPCSEVMPHTFVVATKRNGQHQQIVTGKPVAQPLPVGIDPTGDQATRWKHADNGDLEVPEELSWMFDFDAAVEVGLGIRIPLQDEDFEKGFDAVIALGLRNSDHQTGQAELDQLLTNHLYSDGGLEFLPVDTPTNNTDNVKSAYSGLDNDFDAAFELFMGDQNLELLPNTESNELRVTDGQLFKEGLGLPSSLVGDMRHFAKKDIAEGRAMNRALVNATLKYFMAIMAPNLFNRNDISNTVPFMVNHLSAVGTLPSLRVDEQPYGILPITATSLFTEGGGLQEGTLSSYVHQLAYFLRSTKQIFQTFSRKPSTVNGQKYLDDPQAEFLKILGLAPYSQEFYFRAGSNIAKRWEEPADANIDFPINWNNSHAASTPGNLAQQYYNSLRNGLNIESASLRERIIEGSRAYTNRFFEAGFINGALVQDPKLGNGSLAKINDASSNYIQWLIDLLEDNSPSTVERVFRRLDINQLPVVTHKGEDLVQNTLLLTMLRGALIYDRSSFAKRALEQLIDLPAAKLERLLANHLDLTSYRLDAWLSALADYRLKGMRQQHSSGTYLGAYGFVEHLKPGPTRERAQQVPQGLAPADGKEVYKMPQNQGFVHGPSLNHAVTAAVLRAGYNSLKSKGDNNNALAVNLSSARVRKALFLMEGVSHGQEAGALLGYQLERALHDKYTNSQGDPLEMDVYIYRLRRKFPTYGNRSVEDTNNTSINEQLRPTNVVDGLAMIDYFEDKLKASNNYDSSATFVEMIINDAGATPVFNGYPWGLGNAVPNPAQPQTGSNAATERKKLRALVHELDNMADGFDAMADLMTAEGVYQLVKGNHVRAGAVLKAMAEGTRPIEPEIIKSLRQGTAVNHRAVLTVALQESNPWPSVALTPKAKAEPYLNNWLAQQLGAPETTEWQAQYGETETYLNLGDLALQPIDWVMLLADGSDESQAELQNRSVHYLLENGAKQEDSIQLNFNLASNSSKLSLGEQIALLQNLGATIAKARTADARDYREEGASENNEAGALGLNLSNLQNRLQSRMDDYEQLLNSLAPFTPTKTNYSTTEESLAQEKLRELSGWGFTGFYPAASATGSLQETLSKLVSAKSQMSRHLSWAQNKLEELNYDTDETHWMQFNRELASKFYGQGFKILPQIDLNHYQNIASQLQLAHENSPLRGQTQNGFLDQWLSSAALVRQDLAPLETVRLLSDALHQNACSFKPVQLPFDSSVDVAERDYWLGAEFPESFELDGDRLSLLCFGHENIQATVAGLVLDEWMELIPAAKQTTGIAFHFNQPDARAPQNILLAVPARKTGQWDMDELFITVHEALEQARLRAVEPEHVDFSVLSQMLPATTTLAHGADRISDELDLGGFIDYSLVNYKPQNDQDE